MKQSLPSHSRQLQAESRLRKESNSPCSLLTLLSAGCPPSTSYQPLINWRPVICHLSPLPIHTHVLPYSLESEQTQLFQGSSISMGKMRGCLRLKKTNSNMLLTLFLLFSPFLHNDLSEFFAELGIILLKICALTS